MHNLRVEELEPRQVLNGVSFASQPPPTPPPAAVDPPAPAAVRPQAVSADNNPQLASSNQAAPQNATPPPNASANPGTGGTKATGQGQSAVQALPATREAAPVVTVPIAVQAASTDTDNTVSASTSARSDAVTVRNPSTETAGNSHHGSSPSADSTAALAADVSLWPIALRTASQFAAPAPRGDGQALATHALAAPWPPAAFVPGPRSDGQAHAAAQPLVLSVRDSDVVPRPAYPSSPAVAHGDSPACRIPEFTAPAVIPDQEQGETLTAGLSPQPFGVPALLPRVPLAAVEAGLQQFLQQLERAGRSLTADGEEHGPWSWVVAGAAAAAACEIARRQLRRPEHLPSLSLVRRPGPLTDLFFAG
jgi:hypothetical protein